MGSKQAPIGVFDSGYGGLTILKEFCTSLPQYDYFYLGDNARTPYGSRSFEVVYQYTRQAVMHLFEQGAPLVILACNTASAKALRTIQQKDLPAWGVPERRVLGIIRPTAEVVGQLTKTKHVGIMGTEGTIKSNSYPLEIEKLFPDVTLQVQACPMWVPLVENKEFDKPGADYFVQKYLDELLTRDPEIDTLILGCTHYPLLIDKIREHIPASVQLLSQGEYVAASLKNYLYRHPEMEQRISQGSRCLFYTTESEERFRDSASVFMQESIEVQHINL